MFITEHGEKRLRKRVGIPKCIVGKTAEEALMNGLRHEESIGSLKRYLDKIYLQHEISTNTRVWNEKVFIFQGNKLITVFSLPNRYKDTVKKIINKRIKEGGK